MKECKTQPVRIRVLDALSGQETACIPCKRQESVQQALTRSGIYTGAVCGGRGTCGKCRIRVLTGEVPESEEDIRFLEQNEREGGQRLACRAYPVTDCTIVLMQEETEFSVVSVSALPGKQQKERSGAKKGKLGIAVDIGTTTIAMQLVDINSGRIAGTWTALNRQRAYGADVVSRILASNQGKKEDLRRCIVEQLEEGIRYLSGRRDRRPYEENVREQGISGLDEAGVTAEQIVIAGNTVMLHLLMGCSCETLGTYPFTPVRIDTVRCGWRELCGKDTGIRDIPVVILPGISAYVGADIAAGMLFCGMGGSEEASLFLDLGTNGEMALACGGRILAASTAAGPAFEGGNITCGVGSVPGAVCHVELMAGRARLVTIGGKTPVGICGTGVIETVYELRKEGIIDENGLMKEPFFTEGFVLAEETETGRIVFTQKDVREYQLAKAAVRAGIETLLMRGGLTAGEIGKIYVAGGFGYEMDYAKAAGTGLLPESFAGRIQAAGNSSLGGAVRYLVRQDAAEKLERLIGRTEEIMLANDRDFQEMYLNCLSLA